MYCKNCGNEMNENAAVCLNCSTPSANDLENKQGVKNKKPIYKKWWFWLIIVIVVISSILNSGGNNDKTNGDSSSVNEIVSTTEKDSASKADSSASVTVVDFSTMSKQDIQDWADENGVVCKFSDDYSDTIAEGYVIKQSKNEGDSVKEGDTISIVISRGKKPSVEFVNALKKAEVYSKTMHMSKQGIYDQLTSSYGENFPADAAQYAIDNVEADWNENALATAKTYQKDMHMSKQSVYDQLVSDYGEKFTEEEAQYAIDNLED